MSVRAWFDTDVQERVECVSCDNCKCSAPYYIVEGWRLPDYWIEVMTSAYDLHFCSLRCLEAWARDVNKG